jgi:hypothetical protein
VRSVLLQWTLEQDEDVIEGLQQSSIVVPFSSVWNLLVHEILLKSGWTSTSQGEIQIVEKPETPRSNFVTVGPGHPSFGHMASSTIMSFSVIPSCRIDLFCKGEDSVCLNTTFGTHPPEIDGQEYVTAAFTGVIHVNMFGQTLILQSGHDLFSMNDTVMGEKDIHCGGVLKADSGLLGLGVSNYE